MLIPGHMDLIIQPPLPDQAPLPDLILYALRVWTPGSKEGPYHQLFPEVAVTPDLVLRITRAVKLVVMDSLTGATDMPVWTRVEVMMMCGLLMVIIGRPRLATRLLAPPPATVLMFSVILISAMFAAAVPAMATGVMQSLWEDQNL